MFPLAVEMSDPRYAWAPVILLLIIYFLQRVIIYYLYPLALRY